MTDELRVIIPLSGQTFVFNAVNTENFQTVFDQHAKDKTCDASLTYDDITYRGKSSVVGTEIIVSFDTLVIVPSNTCIVFDCDVQEDSDCKDVKFDITPETRLAILDEQGCLKGYVLVSDLLDMVKDMFPDTLCELLGVDTVPQGHLVASDRILTVADDCSVKSVPVTDIVC